MDCRRSSRPEGQHCCQTRRASLTAKACCHTQQEALEAGPAGEETANVARLRILVTALQQEVTLLAPHSNPREQQLQDLRA